MADTEGSARLERCRQCEGGNWYTECCSGSGGCSCGGDIIDMGPCNVCQGTGFLHPDGADTQANVRAISGYGFIGTGPRSGPYDDLPRMGLR